MDPYLRLLGRPCVEIDGRSIEPAFGKAWGLLLVLAARGEWVERAEIVFLFWADQDEARSRANLRKLLSRNVAALPFARGLEAEPSRLRWRVPSDVSEFRRALAEGRLAHALGLYRGPFLDGIRADGAPEFEAWALEERDALAAAWREAGTTLASQSAGEGRLDDAARVLRSLVVADPLDEEALQEYLRALAASGRVAAALGAYRTFADRLERELGESPSPDTEALVRALREAAPRPAARPPEAATAGPAAAPAAADPAGRVAVEPAAAGADAVAADAVGAAGADETIVATASRALPRSATPFVGRRAELRGLIERLRDPGCRLVTITAPGGFGKTRLALAVADELRAAFRDGAAFVPLARVHDPTGVPFALAEALGVTIAGARPPFEHVTDALADRDTLVVLDNVEHLAHETGWVRTLLDAAPGVRVLATSREPLDVADEWRFELRGLSLGGEGTDLSDSDAARLFLQAAARQDAEAAAAATPGSVARLCRVLDGMPLALELAAGWVGTLSVDDLVAELERDSGLLATARSDVPERHRSVTAVFDASLVRLTLDARGAFEALGVFPGSFDRGAAQAVALATPHVLRDLVARSLLTTTGDGRYHLHELVRHEAAARLAREPAQERAIRDAHARHYDAWLTAAEPALHGRAPAATLAQLDLERDNIEAAFRHVVTMRDLAAIERMGYALETYLVQRTLYAAGAALFGEAADALDERGADTGDRRAAARHTRAALLVWAGWLEFRRGRLDVARDMAERARPLFDERGDPRQRIECSALLGALEGTRGEYDAAWEHFDRSLSQARAADRPSQVANALNNLAITEKQLGLFVQAEAHYREALAINRASGASLTLARNLNNLGLLLLASDRADEAALVLQEGLSLARRAEARHVIPHLLGGLAKAALAKGEYARARAAAEEAWGLTRAAGARGNVGPTLLTLALAAAGEEDAEEADRALAAALEDARESVGRVALLATLATAGRVRSLRGDHEGAVMALTLVREEPLLEHGVRHELGPAWRKSAAAIGPEGVAAAEARAIALGVEGVLARLVAPSGGRYAGRSASSNSQNAA